MTNAEGTGLLAAKGPGGSSLGPRGTQAQCHERPHEKHTHMPSWQALMKPSHIRLIEQSHSLIDSWGSLSILMHGSWCQAEHELICARNLWYVGSLTVSICDMHYDFRSLVICFGWLAVGMVSASSVTRPTPVNHATHKEISSPNALSRDDVLGVADKTVSPAPESRLGSWMNRRRSVKGLEHHNCSLFAWRMGQLRSHSGAACEPLDLLERASCLTLPASRRKGCPISSRTLALCGTGNTHHGVTWRPRLILESFPASHVDAGTVKPMPGPCLLTSKSCTTSCRRHTLLWRCNRARILQLMHELWHCRLGCW